MWPSGTSGAGEGEKVQFLGTFDFTLHFSRRFRYGSETYL